MKKLISLFGSISLLATSSSVVVACGEVLVSQPDYVIASPSFLQIAHVGKKVEYDVFVGGYVESVELKTAITDSSILSIEIGDSAAWSDSSGSTKIEIPAKKLRLIVTGLKVGKTKVTLSYGSAKPVEFSIEVVE